MKTVQIMLPPAAATSYDVRLGSNLLKTAGSWATRCLGKDARRVCVVSDATVFALYGPRVVESLATAGYSITTFVIGSGERSKNLGTVTACLDAFSNDQLGREDAVVALGGGVVGDIAGFAAATHLRGIRFLQIPTTPMGMVDSSVGGKTGVNSSAGKNLIGAFHQPSGVLVDTDVLATLPEREMTAGFCEIVKHATLKGPGLLRETARFLDIDPPHRLGNRSDLIDLIRKSVEFKASIVTGDERESPRRSDAKSRKILNLGHTLAHALEKVTDYEQLRHGEAVGYGLLFAVALSKSLDLLDPNSVKLLNDVVHRVGPLPTMQDIDILEVLEAFRFDKKQVSGALQFVLLKGIGKPVLVSRDQIPLTTIKRALRTVLR